MKKYIVIIAVSLMLLACRKSIHQDGITNVALLNSISDSVTADIDGVHYKFNTTKDFNAKTGLIHGGGATSYSLTAAIPDSNNIYISFEYTGTHPINISTYDSTDAELTVALASDHQLYTNGITVPYRYVNITVTNVTDSSITGTFEGTVYLYTSDSTAYSSKVITNGKFYTSL